MGCGSWESTRNLRLSGRDGFLPWVKCCDVWPAAGWIVLESEGFEILFRRFELHPLARVQRKPLAVLPYLPA
ncbi:MAG: hypothetical protein FJ386_13460 [Verrucomicrobia bacterium]|nr:hypothetical protein [Verrucomicrobiota bacterium]